MTVDYIRMLSQELAEKGYVESAQLLSDGVVSAGEQRAAFDLYRQCLTDAGLTVDGPYDSPIDGLALEHLVSSNGLSFDFFNNTHAACQERYFVDVALVYRETHQARMEPALVEATIRCMADAGVEPAGPATSLAELVGPGGVDSNGVASRRLTVAMDCVRETAHAMYPELPALSIVY
ncbi:MAG: hypothetical protein LBJ44_03695 [Propionibacteriaceae bacterium]|jgi:hypothetical protein|nr:hypothetical protein [Propionibacteriaceae bacterium]